MKLNQLNGPQIARLAVAVSLGIASLMSAHRSYGQNSVINGTLPGTQSARSQNGAIIIDGKVQERDGTKSKADDAAKKAADKTEKKTEFLRLTRSADESPLALQTSLTRYKSEKGDLIVDLIGAVHIGEGDYYKQLNAQFKLYDVVLYELVAPQGTRIPAGGRKGGASNPLSMMQQSAQKMLGLESQLEKVDYQAKNFVHADMSPTEMAEKMAERGDNAMTVGLSAIADMMRNANKAAKEAEKNPAMQSLANESIFELMNQPLKLKQMMASQFTSGGAMEAGLGQTLNQLIVDDRNEACMKVLQKEIVNGQKRIAIFYGAAHMPDFEKRLKNDFGMKKTQQAWVDAWDLTKAPKGRKTSPSSMLLDMLRQMNN